MARQHDLAEKDTTGVIKSLHDTLKAGDLMEFEDTDLRIGGVISIDQLTIKEEDGKIPTYDITLREDKEVGTIQKIQQQISSLQSGNGGTGAGLTTTQVKNQVATEGSKHFISKINDDTAKELSLGKGAEVLAGIACRWRLVDSRCRRSFAPYHRLLGGKNEGYLRGAGHQ